MGYFSIFKGTPVSVYFFQQRNAKNKILQLGGSCLWVTQIIFTDTKKDPYEWPFYYLASVSIFGNIKCLLSTLFKDHWNLNLIFQVLM